jgi:hypothetical protein
MSDSESPIIHGKIEVMLTTSLRTYFKAWCTVRELGKLSEYFVSYIPVKFTSTPHPNVTAADVCDRVHTLYFQLVFHIRQVKELNLLTIVIM